MSETETKPTRKTATKTKTTRPTTYENPYKVLIPQALRDEFYSKGYAITLKRYFIDGREDRMNLMNLIRKGWETVTVQEIGGWEDYFQTAKVGVKTSAVVIGDSVLCKIPLELKQAQDIRKAQDAAAYNQAFANAVEEHDRRDPRLAKLTPVVHEHEETTY